MSIGVYAVLTIIADDFTGAADSAARGLVLGYSAEVLISDTEGSADIVAVNTDTRWMDQRSAYRKARETAECLHGKVYKKIDSLLRGNPAAEINGVMDALGYRAAFAVPAFPENGRIVRDGRLIAGNHSYDILPLFDGHAAHVPSSIAQSGMALDWIGSKLREGIRIFTFDSETDEDLRSIASLLSSAPYPVLPAGSAGLVPYILEGKRHDVSVNIPCCRYMAAAIGSRSEISRKQISSCNLREVWSDGHIARYEGERIVLYATSASSGGDEDRAIADEIAENAMKHIEEGKADSVFMSGGDTAYSMLRRLGAGSLLLLYEIMPGIPLGMISGGIADGLYAVTKSGSFGDHETLRTIFSEIGVL